MKSQINVRTLCIAAAFFACFTGYDYVSAWEWPAPDSTLRAGFLSPEGGLPLRGISFEATDEPLRAAHAGQITFRGTFDRYAPGFVQPQGGFLAVDHGNGLTALYTNLESASSGDELRMRDILGRHVGEPIYFAIFDVQEGVYANPLDILPRRWDPDPPRIPSVFFTQGENRRAAGPRVSLARGPADVSAAVQSHLIPSAMPVLPARIEYAVGAQIHHVMDLDRLVPGVLALGRQPVERPVTQTAQDESPIVVATGDTPFEVPDIDESQVPGIAVTGTVEPTADDSVFVSAADHDSDHGIDGSSDIILWQGGFRRASQMYDAEGGLRLGVINIDARSINTGVIVYDATGSRVRRNVSIDPLRGE
ncbi:MAG: hypothetical protein EA383_04970 [Spirochaetaceae bacterium]|nr:MAG: hypothetical protein EA383_04970 [Spirochaetaceae bacterium]